MATRHKIPAGKFKGLWCCLHLDFLTLREIFFFGGLFLALLWGLWGLFFLPSSPPAPEFSGLYRELMEACPDRWYVSLTYSRTPPAADIPILETFPILSYGAETLEVSSLRNDRIKEEVMDTVPLLEASDLIDINQAPVEEICKLPGIGPFLAEEIVKARRRRSFSGPKDLLRVKGLGPKRLEAIRSYLRFYAWE